MKELLSGNAAIARGAYEYGVTLAAGYPGTPSTEILENLSRYDEVYSEWAPNEKVALEVGIGAAMAGARALVTMKHVGVNVAADPLFTAAYTGVNGGLVLVSADDPGMHSSQNEQDNRYYARFAKIAMLEPADSQEAKDMVGLGLEISEKFDIPVMLRITTRVAHSQSMVELGEPGAREIKQYAKDVKKNLMVPAFGRLRRVSLAERLAKLTAYSESAPVNFIVKGSAKTGVITSGISYQFVREVLPDASVLKLGLTNPLPVELIKQFASCVESLYVVEELEPFLEEQIRMLGIKVTGKELFPATGEFSQGLVRRKFIEAGVLPARPAAENPLAGLPAAPPRPPVLCPGCPHRGVFYTLRRLKLTVTGDIGCYTLGGLPPLEGIDSCVCMGASIGMSHGIDKAVPGLRGKTVAVIGDSTFLHSGITGLLNTVYNGGDSTVIILDNRTTAMTGHQDHPATGRTLKGKEAPEVDLTMLCKALGVPRVEVVDPLDMAKLKEVVQTEVAASGPSVIIARRPCALLKRENRPAVTVDPEKCNGCKTCLRLSCPAISVTDKKSAVDPNLCVGCNLCVQVCKTGAMKGGNACA
ncbi:indolepyruvate ferredoxin oxidoreductase subunit alpha [Desulfotruncus alcoholivorax]|uniref:indolepyruvate ferredoxin oxidoreductase subunit alpha n=1 Tax=Desulfotruncus alcoholivorax TaxID=265477 RepID=UPI0004208909|nr:indolepyruvate ferredoxin oxidoreductase subunit alpha [Desulfotruncus alcoholivorax]